MPGPAAYRKGGEAPTVTDANVVLGYLPADAKLGGDMTIDRGARRKGGAEIADALGLGLEKAAEGIVNIVNENMCGALRLVSVEQGYDPRDFALIAFGGAGPLHANALAKLINSWPVIVPPGPGRALRLWRRDDPAAQRGVAHARAALRDALRRRRCSRSSPTSSPDAAQGARLRGRRRSPGRRRSIRSTCAMPARA